MFTVSYFMRSGKSSWMMSFWMHTPRELSLPVLMANQDVFSFGYSRTQLIIQRSKFDIHYASFYQFLLEKG
jgi:hypothetical protein